SLRYCSPVRGRVLGSFPPRRSSDLLTPQVRTPPRPHLPFREVQYSGCPPPCRRCEQGSAAGEFNVVAVRGDGEEHLGRVEVVVLDRKSTRLNSSHVKISYAVFCLHN